jgi:ribonuclease Z
MTFELTVLGSNSALPSFGRHLSAQILNVDSSLFLIDCGEGTQIRMMDFKVKMNKIERVFISHLHGDHIFGLAGLIMTLGLQGRSKPLYIYSPPGLEQVIDAQLVGNYAFPVYFIVNDAGKSVLLFENQSVEVFSIPLLHRVPCNGFLFVQKTASPNMRKDKIIEYSIPYHKINAIKNGDDFVTENGRIVPHSELTSKPPPPLKYAYCSDTAYFKEIVPFVKGVDLLYHEATFMHDLLDKANKTMHSTARQAAGIARQADVKKLLLGHFSARYKNLNPLLDEAKLVFENTFLPVEGLPVCI